MWPFRSAPQPAETANPPLFCSFCGKSQDKVRKLIAGPTVYICDECIDLCNDIIAEECDQEESPPPRTLGTTLVCPLCRLPRIRDEMIPIAEDRSLCRPCAEMARAALDD